MMMTLGDDSSIIVVSSDPLAAFNAAQTPENNDSVLPPCAGMTLPPGFVGPVNCNPSNGGPTYTPATPAGSSDGTAKALLIMAGLGLAAWVVLR